MALSLEQSTEQTIEPALKRKLLTELAIYAAIFKQIAELEEQKQEAARAIGALREQTGYQSVSLDGYKVTNIQGTNRVLDKKKYAALGGSLTLLEQSYVEKSRRAYERITVPGSSSNTDSSE